MNPKPVDYGSNMYKRKQANQATKAIKGPYSALQFFITLSVLRVF